MSTQVLVKRLHFEVDVIIWGAKHKQATLNYLSVFRSVVKHC